MFSWASVRRRPSITWKDVSGFHVCHSFARAIFVLDLNSDEIDSAYNDGIQMSYSKPSPLFKGVCTHSKITLVLLYQCLLY